MMEQQQLPTQSFDVPYLKLDFDEEGKVGSFQALDPKELEDQKESLGTKGTGTLLIQPLVTSDIGSKSVKVGYKVVMAQGVPAISMTIGYELKRGVTRNSTKSKAGVAFDSKILPVVGSTATKNISISKTGYYEVEFTISVLFPGDTSKAYHSTSSTILLNRMARPYPANYTDPHSGKSVGEPRADWVKTVKPVEWNDKTRKAFRDWYQKTYNLPNFNWTNIDIHHIQPREYGGTNANSNLIPLPNQIHTAFTSWFKGY
ncbi:HNH endonuclease signature motif containing protein [Paenibacillus sp. SN-8-1]|uniref:HNH endonuclease signature motif containing protein n=1 Tax=Paenibacillus sp. SN-8-1 TaxID=3435409 RepID=UPI003D9A9830